ncbi:hypothetical protein EPI10_001453 [Gossypium australe]|uniref:Uncharacterized protein n=1 Tax=Gossypium australe TaxID=47621 RepID=A0A5B6VBH5_9ROSI|nr:hypothetical protein EPI10_001453 [Gossypium australe]
MRSLPSKKWMMNHCMRRGRDSKSYYKNALIMEFHIASITITNGQPTKPPYEVELQEYMKDGHMLKNFPSNPKSIYYVGNPNQSGLGPQSNFYNPSGRNHLNIS